MIASIRATSDAESVSRVPARLLATSAGVRAPIRAVLTTGFRSTQASAT